MNNRHRKAVALTRFVAAEAVRLGIAEHTYVVGGAVRNYLYGEPIKDIDLVVDSVALGGRDSAMFAAHLARAIPTATNVTTNQYGVAILTVKGPWVLDGQSMQDEVVEIANARAESYAGVGMKGKGYKPTDVRPATIEEDVLRREFTFNTLLWRLADLREGPAGAPVIDLTGVGRAHLEARTIHTPLDPDRTFTDDPTRMLRAVKFMIRHSLLLSDETREAIVRNAHRLADMPWEAVGVILVRDIILTTPYARLALDEMRDLGLVDVLAAMVRDTPPFAAYLAGQVTPDLDVDLLLDLAEAGLCSRPVSFLDAAQRARLREVAATMTREGSRAYLAALKQPPINSLALIDAFAIPPKERGVMAAKARTALLSDPSLAGDPAALQAATLEALRAVFG